MNRQGGGRCSGSARTNLRWKCFRRLCFFCRLRRLIVLFGYDVVLICWGFCWGNIDVTFVL